MIDSLHGLPPGLFMIFGAFLLPILGKRFSAWGALGLTLISLLGLVSWVN